MACIQKVAGRMADADDHGIEQPPGHSRVAGAIGRTLQIGSTP
jgi:hypothetical protein